jgi:hypothetical protein
MALGLASAVTTHLDAVARHPGRRACRSVGQHTVGDWRPSYFGACPRFGSGTGTAEYGGASPLSPRACLAWRLRDFATNRHE